MDDLSDALGQTGLYAPGPDKKRFFFSSRRRHTILCQVTGVQTCALPISPMVSIKKRSGDSPLKWRHAIRACSVTSVKISLSGEDGECWKRARDVNEISPARERKTT